MKKTFISYLLALTFTLPAYAKMAPIDVSQLLKESDLIVKVLPTEKPYQVKVASIIASRQKLNQKIIFLQPAQPKSDIERQYSTDGVHEPTLLFLKNPEKNSHRWRPVDYYHSWISLSKTNIPYRLYSEFNIKKNRLETTKLKLGYELLFPIALDSKRDGSVSTGKLFKWIHNAFQKYNASN